MRVGNLLSHQRLLPRDPFEGLRCVTQIMMWEHSIGVDVLDSQVEKLGRWTDPKDAARRAVRPMVSDNPRL